jgi:ABC-type uncharacterized transport system substrate-binding protein
MGLGALGGKLNVGFDQGKTAGILAQKIWAGTAPADIPLVTKNGNRVMVDYRQMQRWDITTQAVIMAAGVPEQAIIVVNKPEDFWRGRK